MAITPIPNSSTTFTTSRIDAQRPLNLNHPLAQHLTGLWIPIPQLTNNSILYDLSLNRRHSQSFTGNIKWQSANVGLGYSIYNDGTGNVPLGNPPVVSNQLTLAVWYSTTTTPSSSMAIMIRDSTDGLSSPRDWQLKVGSGGGYTAFVIDNGANSGVCYGSERADGKWHLITAVYDGLNMLCYHDAVPDKVDASTFAYGLNTSTCDIFLGATNSVVGGQAYSGSIGGVGIWSSALTQSQVSQLYLEGLSQYPTLLNHKLQLWFMSSIGGATTSTGTAIGTSTATANDISIHQTTGTANGDSTATATGAIDALEPLTGTANGDSSATAFAVTVPVLVVQPINLWSPTRKITSNQNVDLQNPLNYTHPLGQNLIFFWLPLSGLTNTHYLINLIQGQNNSQLFQGNITYQPASLSFNNSLNFDGNSSINLGNPLGLKQVTVATWIKTNIVPSAGNSTQIINRDSTDGSGSGRVWQFRLASGGTFEWLVNNDAGSFGSSTGNQNVADNQWHLLAGTYDGLNVIAYIDGVASSNTGTFSTGLNTTNPCSIVVGEANVVTGGSNYQGQIASIQIYSTALNSALVKQLYQEGLDSYPNVINRNYLSRTVFSKQLPSAQANYIAGTGNGNGNSSVTGSGLTVCISLGNASGNSNVISQTNNTGLAQSSSNGTSDSLKIVLSNGVASGDSNGNANSNNVGQSNGNSTGIGNSLEIVLSTGNAPASSNVLSISGNIGNSNGTSNANSNSLEIVLLNGNANGSSTGNANNVNIGNSNGTSNSNSNGLEIAISTGNANGNSLVSSQGNSNGNSNGTSNATSNSLKIDVSTGNINGSSSSTGNSLTIALTSGTANGTSSTSGQSPASSIVITIPSKRQFTWDIDPLNSLNRYDALNSGLLTWYKVLPTTNGSQWYDLVNQSVGTLNGAYGFSSLSRPGGFKSWKGDGSTGYVSGAVTIGTALTVSFWYKNTTDVGGTPYHQFFDTNFNGNGNCIGIFRNSTTTGLYVLTNNAQITSTTSSTVFDGNWHQVVVTFTSTVIKIYVDGQIAVTNNNIFSWSTGTRPLGIGAFYTGGRNLAGCYDDVRVWNHALSPMKVSTIYQDDLSGNLRTLNQRRKHVYLTQTVGVGGNDSLMVVLGNGVANGNSTASANSLKIDISLGNANATSSASALTSNSSNGSGNGNGDSNATSNSLEICVSIGNSNGTSSSTGNSLTIALTNGTANATSSASALTSNSSNSSGNGNGDSNATSNSLEICVSIGNSNGTSNANSNSLEIVLSTGNANGNSLVSSQGNSSGNGNGTSNATSNSLEIAISTGNVNGDSSANGNSLEIALTSGTAHGDSNADGISSLSGIVIGGTASNNANYINSGIGGVVVDGEATTSQYHIYNNFFSGGIVVGGSAGIDVIYNISGIDGVVIGGSANSNTNTFIASGGVLIGGSANNNVDFSISGGVVVGGIAVVSQSHVYNNFFSGGVIVGGNANLQSIFEISTDGGVILEGNILTDYDEISTGGVTVGGNAEVQVITSFNTSSGGVVAGGNVNANLVNNITATGGLIIEGIATIGLFPHRPIQITYPSRRKVVTPTWVAIGNNYLPSVSKNTPLPQLQPVSTAFVLPKRLKPPAVIPDGNPASRWQKVDGSYLPAVSNS